MQIRHANRMNHPSRFWSLPFRMKMALGFGGIFALTVILVVAFMRFGIPFTGYSGSYGAERSKALNILDLVADLKAERLSLWLEERKDDARLLSQQYEVRTLLDALRTLVENDRGSGKSLEGIQSHLLRQDSRKLLTQHIKLVIDAHNCYEKIQVAETRRGVVVASTDEREVGLSIANKPCYQRAMKQRDGVSIAFEESAMKGDPALVVCKDISPGSSIGANRSTPIGVVIMYVNAEQFIRPLLYTGKGLGETGDIVLVNQDQRILISPRFPLPNGRRAVPMQYRIEAEPARLAASGNQGLIESVDYRNVPVIAAFRFIKVSPDEGWGLVVKQDSKEVTKEVNKGILNALFIGLIATGGVGFLALILAGRIARPIEKLSQTAQEVAGGDFNVRAPIESCDEVGELALTFNSMIERLGKSHKELEKQVEDRMAELNQLMEDLKTEIEARKDTEKKLRETEERWNLAIRGANLGVWDWNVVTGDMVFNEQWARMLGYSLADLEPNSRTWKNLIHPEDASRVFDLVDKHRSGETNFFQAEFRMKDKSGKWRWVHSGGAVAERDAKGKAIRMTGVHLDIDGERRARKLVQESEERYRTLVENMSNCVAIYEAVDDGADFVFVDFNRAAEHVEEIGRDRLVGKSVLEIFPSVKDLGLFDVFQRVWRTGRAEHHPVSWYKDERLEGWRDNFVCKLPTGEVVAIYNDETPRKSAEKALRRSEALLNNIIEQSPFSMWISDAEGTLQRINPACKKWTRFTDEQVVGKYNVLKDEAVEAQGLMPLVRSVFEKGKTVNFELVWDNTLLKHVEHVESTVLDLEVTIFPVKDANGEITNAICQHINITDKKKAEEELRRSEQEQRWLLESMINAFAIFESVFDRNGRFVSYRFTYINKAYEEITGVSNEEVYGKTVHEVWPETEPSWVECYGEVAVTGRAKRFEMYHAPTKKLYYCNVYRPWDTRERFCVVFEDITQRRLIAEELRKLNEELEERVRERTNELEIANKDLEAFAYTVSHDLRAPLRAIAGFSQIVARRHKESLNDEGQRYIDNIVKATGQMDRLINDLLSYSRIGRRTVNRESISIKEVALQVAEDLSDRISTTGAELIIPDELPLVSGDWTLLTQIVTNLLDNALLYVRENVPPRIEVSAHADKDFAVICVKDNGMGIAPEYQRKIFDLFQRLHGQETYPGTGIGLAVVKKSAQMLGGTVWVESKVGEGSTFSVRLPTAI